MKALAVDDEAMVLRLLARMLQSLGCEVTCASCTAEALEAIGARSFDLVVTDFGLPDGTGAELASQIKADHPDLPVIIVTGWGETIDAGGADMLIEKPYSSADLQAAIGALCGRDGDGV